MRVLPLAAAVLVSCGDTSPPSFSSEPGITSVSGSTGSSGAGASTTSTGPEDDSAGGSVSTGTGTLRDASQAASTTNLAPDTTDGSGSSSTGPVEPICGNGAVEEGETCDDGNADPDDGCKECASDSIVFISSETYQGFSLDGLYGADQRCRSLAAKAGLLRPETFRAWLSTPTMSAEGRLSHSRGRYKLVNGLVIAQDWASLTSGGLSNTITVDEKSQSQDTRVWTGTLADGQPAIGSDFCGDWDDDSGLLLFGGAGRSLAADAGWSFFAESECGSQYRLYCFEN